MSILNVNKLGPVGGSSTITVAAGVASYTGKINCPEFDNNPSFTGNVTIAGNLGVAGTITYEDVARVDATGISTFREGYQVGPLTGIALTAYKDGSIRTTGIITATSFSGTASTATSAATAYALDSAANITTGIVTATAFVPSAGQLSHRNIIINGDMRVAQRASSSTTSGYGDLDRWQHEYTGTNENPTFAQVSLTTSDTPYTLGLTKAAKITNGNQTSGLQASSQINFNQQIEAQNIRNSGWNYKSSSSYITLSFWVRSSVSQNFNGFVKTQDGSNYIYPYETGTLSANTWTKITKSIPGNSNLQIDDDTGGGFQVFAIAIYGTNMTDNSVTYNQWAGWASGSRSKDQANSWFTTNDATLEITGVQLEVGPVATPFEHRRFDDQLFACQRYYCELGRRINWDGTAATGDSKYSFIGLQAYGTAALFGTLANFPKKMRVKPTITMLGHVKFSDKGGTNIFAPNASNYNAITHETVGTHGLAFSSNRFIQGGFACAFTDNDNANYNYIKADAEL